VSSIAKHIKKLRLQNKMTQEEMAGRLFVTRQTVSNWETGKSQPDIDTLMAIAETLHTDTTTLIYGPPPPADRKKEIRRLIIAGGILLILACLWFWLEPVEQRLRYMLMNEPLLLLRLILLPAIWLVAGWTAVQGLRVPGLLKPVRHLSGKIIFIAALAIVLLYVVIMLPFWIETVKCMLLTLQYRQNPELNGGYFSYEYNIPQFLSEIEFAVMVVVAAQPVVFAIPGLLLGLCQPERKRKKPLVSS
jgi:transcriptional regulator with XRE-family HTH domain